jgi:hypothetical protein
MEHVQGTELFACDNVATWTAVAETLADVQISWMGNANELLVAGATDLRAASLAAKIPVFIEYMTESMDRQPTTLPAKLTRLELSELAESLYILCADVDSLPFAEGLSNADFSPHNTLIASSGPVFIDWAEVCVSLPMIAGEYFWNRMVTESPARAPWQTDLRSAYMSRWSERYEAADVEHVTRILPVFSVFAVANFYHSLVGSTAGGNERYLRSLVRKLSKSIKETLCQSRSVHAL